MSPWRKKWDLNPRTPLRTPLGFQPSAFSQTQPFFQWQLVPLAAEGPVRRDSDRFFSYWAKAARRPVLAIHRVHASTHVLIVTRRAREPNPTRSGRTTDDTTSRRGHYTQTGLGWWAKQDLNLHDRSHQVLSLACLPIPPFAQITSAVRSAAVRLADQPSAVRASAVLSGV